MDPSTILKVQVVVFCRAPEIQVLLLQRPPERGHIWQHVTGKMEPDDPHCLHAAMRELAEETGITDALHFIETGVEFHFKKNGQQFEEHLLGAEVERYHPVHLSGEHVAFAWLSPFEAASRLAWESNREGLQVVLSAAL